MEYKDYYAALGVDRKADKDEIQKAYRKLARKLHPDVNKTPEAEARFKEVTEAYEVLKNKEKRAKYDQFGSAWQQSQHGGGAPPGFEDIFSAFGQGGGGGGFRTEGSGFSSFFDALFGGGAGGGNTESWNWQGAGQRPAAGADHEANIALSLEDAARGGQREITITDPTTGRNKRLRVKIPPGVRSGQRIRLGGQGGTSPTGAQRGDLYLKINLLDHPSLKLDGNQLTTQLEVSPALAALGGEVSLQTLNGDVRVRVPPGSSSGRRIRLRGKGYPAGKSAGDLIAEIRLVVPKDLTDEERALYQQLADLSAAEPEPDTLDS